MGRHRVARLMRWEGLRGCAKQRFRRTATVRAELPAAPNLLNGDFWPKRPIGSGSPTSRKCEPARVGSISRSCSTSSRARSSVTPVPRPRARSSLSKLSIAPFAPPTQSELIHHSDRGGQYLSAEYQDRLDRHGIVCSMSRPGRCADNAAAESFFDTLKTEWLYHFDFFTREEARLAIFDYVEAFYNRNRLHSSLDYHSPEEYETLHNVLETPSTLSGQDPSAAAAC